MLQTHVNNDINNKYCLIHNNSPKKKKQHKAVILTDMQLEANFCLRQQYFRTYDVSQKRMFLGRKDFSQKKDNDL